MIDEAEISRRYVENDFHRIDSRSEAQLPRDEVEDESEDGE